MSALLVGCQLPSLTLFKHSPLCTPRVTLGSIERDVFHRVKAVLHLLKTLPVLCVHVHVRVCVHSLVQDWIQTEA